MPYAIRTARPQKAAVKTKRIASQLQPHSEASPSTQQVRPEDPVTGVRALNGSYAGQSKPQRRRVIGLLGWSNSKRASSHDSSSNYLDGPAGSHDRAGDLILSRTLQEVATLYCGENSRCTVRYGFCPLFRRRVLHVLTPPALCSPKPGPTDSRMPVRRPGLTARSGAAAPATPVSTGRDPDDTGPVILQSRVLRAF